MIWKRALIAGSTPPGLRARIGWIPVKATRVHLLSHGTSALGQKHALPHCNSNGRFTSQS